MSREDCEVSEEYQLIFRGVSEKKSMVGKSVTLTVTERWRFVGKTYRAVRTATNPDLYRPELEAVLNVRSTLSIPIGLPDVVNFCLSSAEFEIVANHLWGSAHLYIHLYTVYGFL